MNKLKKKCLTINLVLFSIFVTIIFINCDDKKETRRSFKWSGTINNMESQGYVVECDNACVACTATSLQGDEYYFYKSQHLDHPIIQRCLQLDPGTGGNPVIFSVEIKEMQGFWNKYGFDYWKELFDQGDFTVARVSYISLAAGDSIKFKVILNLDSAAFDKYVVEITHDNTFNLSFEKNSVTSEKELISGLNIITLYSLNTQNTGNAYISVKAQSGDEEFCLAGDCETKDDDLRVQVYKPKELNSVKLIRINNPYFNPSTEDYLDTINKVLKQAVVAVDTVTKHDVNDMSWDLNGNNIFDYNEGLPNADTITPLPDDINEVKKLLEVTNEIDGCYKNTHSALLTIKGPIRYHWIIDFSFPAGDSVISLNWYNNLDTGQQIEIGRWLSDGTNRETVYIREININNDYIIVSQDPTGPIVGTKYAHNTFESFWSEFLNGVVLRDSHDKPSYCACIRGDAPFSTHLHELLHQIPYGNLRHVQDVTNIMFPFTSGRKGTKLRYRPLRNYEDPGELENQWQTLQDL